MKKDTEDKRTLLLELKNGETRRITIPQTWRVTFGPTVPGLRRDPKAGYDNSDGRVCLRLYDGEDQKAAFTDVVGFRDAVIAVEERRTRVKRENVVRQGKHGDKVVQVEGRITEWVNPDVEASEEEVDEELNLLEDLRRT